LLGDELLKNIPSCVAHNQYSDDSVKGSKMNRRELLVAAVAAVVATSCPFGRALQAWAVAPADALVTITKTDGTTARGKITSYDRDKVTMDVVAKPKVPPVSTIFTWDEIKTVSNGLTRQKALQRWKGENHNSLCQTCFGDGKAFCTQCHGTAHDPAASAGCPTCKGAAQLACTTPRCDHGNIPCPNPKCLKLSDGGWYKKPDRSRWKKFNTANGYKEWSEHHIGQVIDKIDGDYQNLGECPVCGGIATITDPVCRGTSMMPCSVCTKKAKSPACPAKCESGIVQCPTCRGTGMKT
jgi:hypothetical protein